MTTWLENRYSVTKDFNSHAHVERDYLFKNTDGMTDDFNSHAHVERDIMKLKTVFKICISTHTLTWSVTRLYFFRGR